MSTTQTRMPALFLGHGTPMNTLADNRYTRAWRSLGLALPRPKAILAISAHWYVRGVAVTAMKQPKTIHDFGGFPQALFDVRYPAPGSPALAARVAALLRPKEVMLDQSWGLDHGTWSVLCHLYPDADIPVVQLAIDRSQPPAFHYELGRQLAALRDEAVLIVGSGNVVHNLMAITRPTPGQSPGQSPAAAYDWAARFEQKIKEQVLRREHPPLIAYEHLDGEARLAVPTPEHYLPLLYVLGAMQEGDAVSFPTEGIDMGSLSMLSIALGIE